MMNISLREAAKFDFYSTSTDWNVKSASQRYTEDIECTSSYS